MRHRTELLTAGSGLDASNLAVLDVPKIQDRNSLIETLEDLKISGNQDLSAVLELVVIPSFKVELQLPPLVKNVELGARYSLPGPEPVDALVTDSLYQSALRLLVHRLDVNKSRERPVLKQALSLLKYNDDSERTDILWSCNKLNISKLLDNLRILYKASSRYLREAAGESLRVTEHQCHGMKHSVISVYDTANQQLCMRLYYSHFKYQALISESYNFRTKTVEAGSEQLSVQHIKIGSTALSGNEVKELVENLDLVGVSAAGGDSTSNTFITMQKFDLVEELGEFVVS